jgi:hypothetical protein
MGIPSVLFIIIGILGMISTLKGNAKNYNIPIHFIGI